MKLESEYQLLKEKYENLEIRYNKEVGRVNGCNEELTNKIKTMLEEIGKGKIENKKL